MFDDQEIRAYRPEVIISFKRSDIANMSSEEYRRNRADILKAHSLGLIADDMVQPLGSPPVAIFKNDDDTLSVEDMPDKMGRHG